MSSVSYYKRKDSNYFYLRIYKSEDVEPNPRKRRTSKSTKILTTQAGERQIKRMVKEINTDFKKSAQSTIFGNQIRSFLLSEGLDFFLASKPDLAEKTKEVYDLSTTHFIRACSDKKINTYFDTDYIDLINYLNKKGFAQASKSIFTRHLSAMWNYFIKKQLAEKNIIVKIKSTKANSMPIPYKDMQRMFRYYRQKNQDQYYFVYFLLLTGMRPSSAILIKWENIKFEQEYIDVRNVKGKRDFLFPLHTELKKMFVEMGIKKKGKVFIYSITPNFFNKDCKLLFLRGNIGYKYTFSQLRNTFSSWLANKGVNLGSLQTLLDHTDQKITKKHYTQLKLVYLKKEIEQVKFKDKRIVIK